MDKTCQNRGNGDFSRAREYTSQKFHGKIQPGGTIGHGTNETLLEVV